MDSDRPTDDGGERDARPAQEEDAAETLRRSSGELRQTSEEIRRTRERLERRTRSVEKLAETTRRMRERTASLREGVLADRPDLDPQATDDGSAEPTG